MNQLSAPRNTQGSIRLNVEDVYAVRTDVGMHAWWCSNGCKARKLSADTSRSVLQTLHARQDQQPSMVGTASRNAFFCFLKCCRQNDYKNDPSR